MRPTTSLLLLLLPGAAQAAGYFTTGVGVRCMGRGAACAAGASDLSAQYYNPAALTRVRSMLDLQLAGVHQAVHFDRADEPLVGGGTLTFDEVRNEAPPMPIPALGGLTHFGVPDLALAFGVYTPYAPLLSFPADGPQRFSLASSTVLSGNVGPSVAYRFWDRLSVGAGLAFTFLQVEQSLSTHMAPRSVSCSDELQYDIRTSVTARDPFALTWNAGLLWEPEGGAWAAGLSFVPPVHFRAEGTLTADFSQNAYYTGESGMGQIIAVESVSDDAILLDVSMPLILSAGGLWRVSERTELELDASWQRWSGLGQLTLSEVDLWIDLTTKQDASITDDIVLPSTLRDAFYAGLGAESRLHPRLAGRAGLFFESSAVSRSFQAVAMPDGAKLGYGLGASVALVPERLDLDLGWSQAFVLPHEIDRSEVFQVAIDPLSGEVYSGKQVGNGTFSAMTTLFALGLVWTPGA